MAENKTSPQILPFGWEDIDRKFCNPICFAVIALIQSHSRTGVDIGPVYKMLNRL